MDRPAAKTITYRRVVDLTHRIHPGIPLWPGDPPVAFEAVATIARQGYYLRRFDMGEHSGTHLSSPAAFYADGAGPEDLPPAALVVPAVVMDISRAAAENPDYALTTDDIARWERRHGTVPAGAMVLLCAGWHRYWGDPPRFINADGNGVMHTPGFGPDAARLLLEARGVAGLGTDTPGIDAGADAGLSVSRMTLAQPRLALECLNNLDRLPPAGATLVIGRLPLVGGSGAPVSALALTP